MLKAKGLLISHFNCHTKIAHNAKYVESIKKLYTLNYRSKAILKQLIDPKHEYQFTRRKLRRKKNRF